MTSPRLCAISVDLDEIHNYYGIHGRTAADLAGRTAVYDVAMPRLRMLARGLQVPMTFFAVGEDLQREAAAAELRRAAAAGHGIANHSFSHLYDLTRRDRATIAKEIDDGTQTLLEATGVRPQGFRAPGYTITDTVFEVLAEQGYRYDSSVFPCPFYKGLKDTAILTYRALGRPTKSVIDTPAVLLAPTRPYRVGRPYYRPGHGLLELPIQVTRRARLPYIGTFLMMAGPERARWATRQLVGEPLINLELHGIDLLDERDEGLAALASSQRDLRIPRERKVHVLEAIVETLRASGYSFVTLDEAAERLGGD